VECCGGEPCTACSKQLLQCLYNEAEERRRTHTSRIARIRQQQSGVHRLNHALIGEQGREVPEDVTLHSQSSQSPGDLGRVQSIQQGGYTWNNAPSRPGAEAGLQRWNLSDQQSEPSIEAASASWSCSNRPSPQDQSNMQNLTGPTPFPTDFSAQEANGLPSFSDGDIIRRPQLLEYANSWPAEVDEASLLPWLDSYFKRLSPIVPVLSHIAVYEAMLLGRHRSDRDLGAMILSMCSIVMIQAVYTEEAAHLDERTKTAKLWMQHSARMRSTWDFGQDPTIETILTSFFLFGCLFSNGQQRAAWHQLRLAVDMSCQIGLDQPDVYLLKTKQEREQRIRIYLSLAVTERYGFHIQN